MKTGKLIEALMHYNHIGLEEMANSVGIAQNNLSTLISGRRNITPSLAKKIGKALSIDPIVIMTNRMTEEFKENKI